MVIHVMWIINKTGGLIYNKVFQPGLAELTPNVSLKLSGSFFTQHAIAMQLSPVPGCGGIDCIEAEGFKLWCLETPTGIKFIVITDPGADNSRGQVSNLLNEIYVVYSDYVMKTPFHDWEQPIHVEKFDLYIRKTIEQLGSA
eukprot:TRINITY_DN61801_c0_g1_i1.p2 TRINITY_DN61801_c0_g1~~TRINITY_DN61801_c0_g1_i1.p2  ORF type:complete len:142 (+),score=31.02 TRINITY_DN61801_c0_g1_i1:66-491(+)